jgi:predicted murein hydrolase (TIGR00659 family)
MNNLIDLWVYLRETPLFWLTLTLVIFQASVWVLKRLPDWPVLNPFLSTTLILIAVLLVTDTPYETYISQAGLLQFLLGPATVALAIPMYRNVTKLKQMLVPLLVCLPIGSLIAILSVYLLGHASGLSQAMQLSLLPKSVTTPIAMGIAEQINGLPALAAVFVLLTGIVGTLIATPLLDFFKINDLRVRGFAVGLSLHGIGTARMLQISQEAGAFSGLAMALNGSLSAILIPVIVYLLG